MPRDRNKGIVPFFSPEGALVNSQGGQPLVQSRRPPSQPRRGGRACDGSPVSAAPSGLLRSSPLSIQGLTPLAIDDRPFGAEERPGVGPHTRAEADEARR